MTRGTPTPPRAHVRVAVVACAIVAIACGGGPGGTPATTEAPTRPSSASPAPTSARDDWTWSFDGETVKGLRGYDQSGFPDESWRIADGRLWTIPGAGVDLITDAPYGDLELEFTWGVGPGGNSGVMIAVSESGDPAWATGPEYQLLDDDGHPDGRDPRTSAAALYGLLAPDPARRLAPVGEPNVSRIIVRDRHVEHWLDGRMVLAYGWDDADLRAAIATSKFADLPGFMASPEGRIVLQHHGDLAWFGPIRVRALGDDR